MTGGERRALLDALHEQFECLRERFAEADSEQRLLLLAELRSLTDLMLSVLERPTVYHFKYRSS